MGTGGHMMCPGADPSMEKFHQTLGPAGHTWWDPDQGLEQQRQWTAEGVLLGGGQETRSLHLSPAPNLEPTPQPGMQFPHPSTGPKPQLGAQPPVPQPSSPPHPNPGSIPQPGGPPGAEQLQAACRDPVKWLGPMGTTPLAAAPGSWEAGQVRVRSLA